MRCFVALDLPKEAQDALAKLQAEARFCDVDATFVNTAIQHVTLVFLGEVPESKVPALVDAFKQVKMPPLKVELKGTGFYPSPKFIKVFWIGVDGGQPLLTLEEQLATALQVHEKRVYKPHVAVCRPKTNRNLDCLRKLAERTASERFASFDASTVTFYKSVLGPAGPAYTALAQISPA